MPLFKRVNKDGSISLDPMDPQSHQPFPGFKEAFDADFVVSEGFIETLSPVDIAPLSRIRLFEPRVKHLVDLLVSRLRVLADKPSPPDVVIVALPTDVRSLVNNPTKHLHTRKPRKRAVSFGIPGLSFLTTLPEVGRRRFSWLWISTPSRQLLSKLVNTAPYFHDNSPKTLGDVVRHYARFLAVVTDRPDRTGSTGHRGVPEATAMNRTHRAADAGARRGRAGRGRADRVVDK
jgi:hypothetical protein